MKRKHPTIGAVIPTMDRPEILRQALRSILEHDFDEVVVVDSSGPVQRKKNEKLCRNLGVIYHHMVGNREEARNFGVRMATSDWVSIRDDDVEIAELDMEGLRRVLASGDYDFFHASAKCVWLFKRAFFLRIGGYDVKLCSGDDFDITYRAYKHGKVCKLTKDLGKTVEIEKTVEMHWKGLFNYTLTLPAYFRKYPSLRIAFATVYRPVLFFKQTLLERRRGDLLKFVFSTIGALLSPLYLVDHKFFNELLLRM